jgi:putative membrane protein
MLLGLKNIRNYFSDKKRFVETFFIIFYTVGFIGSAAPFSHQLFLKLFPLALLMSFVAILLFHQDTFNAKTIIVLAMIGIWSFFIEVTGVNTHLIFGNYRYGNALGIKLFNTPILIAINWVMLTYTGSSITERTSLPLSLKIIISSLLVLLYDLVLEQIAPALDMWYWEREVPLQNYVAWFVIAVIFQIFIRVSGIKTRNSIAIKIILIQIIFFISLIVYFKLTK